MRSLSPAGNTPAGEIERGDRRRKPLRPSGGWIFWSLAHIASHAGQHASGGTDPLVIDGDGIRDASVVRSKLGADVKILAFSDVAVEPEDWQEDSAYGDFPFRADVTLEGVTENFVPSLTFAPEDALSGIFAPVVRSFQGGVYIYAGERPENSLSIPGILCIPVG